MRNFVTTIAAAVIVIGFTAAVQAQGNGGAAQGDVKSQIGVGMGNNNMSGHMHKRMMMHRKHHKMMHDNNA